MIKRTEIDDFQRQISGKKNTSIFKTFYNYRPCFSSLFIETYYVRFHLFQDNTKDSGQQVN